MDATNNFGIGADGYLKGLANRIEQQLEERQFCVVFEDEVEMCWPCKKNDRFERERQIQAFAESRTWNVFVHNTDSGLTRAVFLRD